MEIAGTDAPEAIEAAKNAFNESKGRPPVIPEPQVNDAASDEDESTLESAAGADDGEEEESSTAKKSRGDKRFDKLTKEKTELEKERDLWRKEALKKAEDRDGDSPKAKSEPAAPKKPVPEDYDTHESFLDALSTFAADQAVAKARKDWEKEQKDARDKEVREKVESTWKSRLAKAREAYDDFDELVTENKELPISETAAAAIMDSELGPQIAYWLAQNPEKAEAISKMAQGKQLVELGKIEARLEGQLADKEDSPAVDSKSTREKPAPIKTVASTGKGSIKTSIYDANLSFAEFKKLENARLNKK